MVNKYDDDDDSVGTTCSAASAEQTEAVEYWPELVEKRSCDVTDLSVKIINRLHNHNTHTINTSSHQRRDQETICPQSRIVGYVTILANNPNLPPDTIDVKNVCK